MAETGFVLVGSGAASGSGAAWSNPGNITVLGDAASATSSVGSGASQQIIGSDLGFTVPSGATIDGIEVRIRRSSPAANARDNTIKLVIAGVAGGNNLAALATSWPGSATSRDYGSAAELWGLSLTPAIVNASGFGAVVVASGPAKGAQAQVYNIWLNVHYTPAPTSKIFLGASNVLKSYVGGSAVAAAYLGINKVF